MNLLVFVSSHCSHCPSAVSAVKKILPKYEEYGIEYEKIRAKTQKAKEISGNYGIRAYPTIVGVKDNGEIAFKITGTPSEEKLKKEIEKGLGLKKSIFSKIFGEKT